MPPDQQRQNLYNQAPQQHASGQYEVVPPPLPTSNVTGHNPYDFILADKPKKAKFSFNPGANKKSMFVWVGALLGGVMLVLIVVAVLIAALAPKGSTPGLIAIAQRQQEIIRIADAATKQATSQDVLNFVSTIDLSIITSQQQVLARITSNGTKLSAAQLSLDESAQTDATLANAASANTYDTAVVQNLASQLRAYDILLQNTTKQSTSKQTRILLGQASDGANQLLNQAKTVTTAD